MRRMLAGSLFVVVMACAFASAASAASAPSLSASFDQSTASIGSTDPLTFTITGGDAAVGGLGFSVDFPAGLNVAAATSSECWGTVTTTPAPEVTPPGGLTYGGTQPSGAFLIQLSGASVAAGGSCSFSVPVAVQGAGTLRVTTSHLTAGRTYHLTGNSTTASVTVPAIASPATVNSAFSPSTVDATGTTTWTVAITNPNTSTTLTDVRFYMGFLVGNGIGPWAITANTCGGTGFVDGLSPVNFTEPAVRYGGGTLPPGGSCSVSASIRGGGIAISPVRQPVTVVTNEGGPSAVSTATLTVLAPNRMSVPGPTPSKAPSNTFTHTKPKIARNGTITEAVKLPGKGTVRLRETWRGRLIAHVQKTVKRAEKLTIKLVPSAAARRALKSSPATMLKLSVTYTPTGGKARIVKLTGRTPR